MELKSIKLKDCIFEVDARNTNLEVNNLLGVTINKVFIPSVANINGTDLSKYKIINKNQFVCGLMQVSRDEGVAIALYKNNNIYYTLKGKPKKMTNRERFIEIFQRDIKREGADKLLAFLKSEDAQGLGRSGALAESRVYRRSSVLKEKA